MALHGWISLVAKLACFYVGVNTVEALRGGVADGAAVADAVPVLAARLMPVNVVIRGHGARFDSKVT